MTHRQISNFYSLFCKFCAWTYFALLQHLWRTASTCSTSAVAVLALPAFLPEGCGMEASLRLETKDCLKGSIRGFSSTTCLTFPRIRSSAEGMKTAAVISVPEMWPTVENSHMKHCHNFYLLPHKGATSIPTIFLQMIVHEVPVTYPRTWGTCISSLSFETLHKGMKAIIIHHPDAGNTKKTLAWMFI